MGLYPYRQASIFPGNQGSVSLVLRCSMGDPGEACKFPVGDLSAWTPPYLSQRPDDLMIDSQILAHLDDLFTRFVVGSDILCHPVGFNA